MKLPHDIPNAKLVFQHIPKTAGTTIHDYLVNFIGEDNTCKARFDDIINYPRGNINRLTFFSGHYNLESINYIPGKKFVFTFFRDPTERIKSLYRFWASHTDEAIEKNNLIGPRLSKEYNFSDFLKLQHQIVEINFNNHLTKMITGLTVNQFNHLVENNQEEVIISLGKQAINNLFFIGFQETFSEDFEALLTLLSIPVSKPFKRVRDSKKFGTAENIQNKAVTTNLFSDIEQTKHTLQKLTYFDDILFNYALSIKNQLNDRLPL